VRKQGIPALSMHPGHEAQQFARGIEQFNHRRFFEAHETWEEIWLSAPEPDKTFLQGMIQAAAAFHHYTRGNRLGAQSLLREGLIKLEKFPNGYRGVHLKTFREAVGKWADALAAGESPDVDALPRIERA
jgi:predicted metal-dependent hydrolase